jgi:hypothetical protein
MSDQRFDDDDILQAFDDFTRSASSDVMISGTASIRRTVRRRRTVQTAAISLLAVLLVAVPVVTYATSTHKSNGPPAVVAGPSGPPSPSSSPSASQVSASPAPSVSGSTSPTAAPVPLPPGGAWTPQDLVAARVPIPEWHFDEAPADPVKDAPVSLLCDSDLILAVPAADDAINHEPNPPHVLSVAVTVSTNLDSDPAPETAALLVCQYGESAWDAVVGYDRDANGKPVLLGVIAEGHIWSLTARSGGGVTIDISDSQSCCDRPRADEDHQSRSFAWNGSRFTQVAGPTSFYPHPHAAVLSIHTSSTGWGAPVKGSRTGKVTITIKNTSSYATNPLVISDGIGKVWPAAGTEPATTTGSLAPGASVTVVLNVSVYSDAKPADAIMYVYELGSSTIGSHGNEVTFPLWK